MQLYCLRVARLQELLSGNGILLDYHVMRHLTDIEAIYTYAGPSRLGPRLADFAVGMAVTWDVGSVGAH